MYVGIRDVCLFRAGYGNIAQAMDELSLVDIELVEQFASDTRHVHCKNIDYPSRYRQQRRPLGWEYGQYVAPIHQGNIDYSKIVQILAEAGYQGGLHIEDESLAKFGLAQRRRSLRQQVEYLTELVADFAPRLY